MNMQRKTVILGATTNSSRYAYLAAMMLKEAGHEIVPLGIRKGEVLDQTILDLRRRPHIEDPHTITMYINPVHQQEWADYILQLAPKRIIFNPGTENPELQQHAGAANIEVLNACTLVLLRTNQY